MKFGTAKQMLDYINEGNDLYSRKAETYVFSYNDEGSVCTYILDESEAASLARQVKNSEEKYWSAFLGTGGKIWDDPRHYCYKEGQVTNLDCCEKLVEYEDWVLTQHYLGEPIALTVKIEVELKKEDIDDIMCCALEGGINYWCNEAEVVEGEYYGEFASEQISNGGSLRIYDMEEDKTYLLDLEKFIEGFKIWISKGYDRYGAVSGKEVDCCQIDAECADGIVQCALFGDIIYG